MIGYGIFVVPSQYLSGEFQQLWHGAPFPVVRAIKKAVQFCHCLLIG